MRSWVPLISMTQGSFDLPSCSTDKLPRTQQHERTTVEKFITCIHGLKEITSGPILFWLFHQCRLGVVMTGTCGVWKRDTWFFFLWMNWFPLFLYGSHHFVFIHYIVSWFYSIWCASCPVLWNMVWFGLPWWYLCQQEWEGSPARLENKVAGVDSGTKATWFPKESYSNVMLYWYRLFLFYSYRYVLMKIWLCKVFKSIRVLETTRLRFRVMQIGKSCFVRKTLNHGTLESTKFGLSYGRTYCHHQNFNPTSRQTATASATWWWMRPCRRSWLLQ